MRLTIMPRTDKKLIMGKFDPRLFAARHDLADAALRGQVDADAFVSPSAYQCKVAWEPIFHAPGGEQGSELLLAEQFMVLEVKDGWAWGWCAHDHYVGYIRADVLTDDVKPVAATSKADPVDFARQFLGMPYVWGGRGGEGIDCSGLVQRSMAAQGVSAQRDSDMQQNSLGRILKEDEQLQRGDILFFPGHVGMMTDGEAMIHATRAFNKTVEEPLADALIRIAKKNDGVTILARRRVEP
jgi:cell wall-associated NlpC family hydrolase